MQQVSLLASNPNPASTGSGAYARNAAQKILQNVQGRVYADLETIGDIGSENFAVTQMATGGKSGDELSFFKISKKAADAMKSNIALLRQGKRLDSVTRENAMRSLNHMLGYSTIEENGARFLSYRHNPFNPRRTRFTEN